MNDFLQIYLQAAALIFVAVTALWLLSLWLKNASIADVFWGSGFVMCCWLYFLQTPDGAPLRKWLVCALVTIWGLRLSIYIFSRNAGKPEDYRYAKWREENGNNWWWRSFFKVFLLQGFLMWLISAPLLAAQISATPAQLIWLDVLAAIIWLTGFFFETVGDWQLAKFKSQPENRGKLMTSGVWRYTRHPNYFGDTAQWWGFFGFALAAGGWWSVFSPVLMTWLIVKISGVAMLESNLRETKPGFAEYVRRTNAFIPWFPKQ